MQKNFIWSKEIFRKKFKKKKIARKWKKPHKKFKGLVFFKSKVYGALCRRQLLHWTFKKKYINLKKKRIFNFYTYYLGIKKIKLKNLLDFTIKKLSSKRKASTIFYPEQRLDVFLARLFNKQIENVHRDISQWHILVNNKVVFSCDFVLRNKDFIQVRSKYFFQRVVKNTLNMCKFSYNRLVFNHISFPILNLICFLEENSFNYLERSSIRKGFVKRAYIWQVIHPRGRIKCFLNSMFNFKMLDIYLQK